MALDASLPVTFEYIPNREKQKLFRLHFHGWNLLRRRHATASHRSTGYWTNIDKLYNMWNGPYDMAKISIWNRKSPTMATAVQQYLTFNVGKWMKREMDRQLCKLFYFNGYRVIDATPRYENERERGSAQKLLQSNFAAAENRFLASHMWSNCDAMCCVCYVMNELTELRAK